MTSVNSSVTPFMSQVRHHDPVAARISQLLFHIPLCWSVGERWGGDFEIRVHIFHIKPFFCSLTVCLLGRDCLFFSLFFFVIRAQELCESRGGPPGLPVLYNTYGLCGRKASLYLNFFLIFLLVFLNLFCALIRQLTVLADWS